MGSLSFPWVNAGAPFEVGDLPVRGQLELNAHMQRRAKVIATYTKALRLHRANIIAQVKRVLDERGREKAMALWKQGIPSMLAKQLREEIDWPAETFEQSLNSWFEDYVAKEHGEADPKKALKVIADKAERIDMELLGAEIGEFEIRHFIKELYWHLYWRFQTITLPDKKEVPLTEESLELVAKYPEDARRLHEAVGRAVKPDLGREMAMPDEESVVLGNSERSAASSSASKPSSDSTSTLSTATERPSAAVTPQSG